MPRKPPTQTSQPTSKQTKPSNHQTYHKTPTHPETETNNHATNHDKPNHSSQPTLEQERIRKAETLHHSNTQNQKYQEAPKHKYQHHNKSITHTNHKSNYKPQEPRRIPPIKNATNPAKPPKQHTNTKTQTYQTQTPQINYTKPIRLNPNRKLITNTNQKTNNLTKNQTPQHY